MITRIEYAYYEEGERKEGVLDIESKLTSRQVFEAIDDHCPFDSRLMVYYHIPEQDQ